MEISYENVYPKCIFSLGQVNMISKHLTKILFAMYILLLNEGKKTKLHLNLAKMIFVTVSIAQSGEKVVCPKKWFK